MISCTIQLLTLAVAVCGAFPDIKENLGSVSMTVIAKAPDVINALRELLAVPGLEQLMVLTILAALPVWITTVSCYNRFFFKRRYKKMAKRLLSTHAKSTRQIACGIDDSLMNLSKPAPLGPPYIHTILRLDLDRLYRRLGGLGILTPRRKLRYSDLHMCKIDLTHHIRYLETILPAMERGDHELVMSVAQNYVAREDYWSQLGESNPYFGPMVESAPSPIRRLRM